MFFKKLNTFFADLEKNEVTNEWYISDFADENIKKLEQYEAYDILKLYVPYMIEKYNQNFEYEILEIFRYLKYQVNSNEIFLNDEQKNKIFELYQQDYSKIILRELF